MDFPDKAFRSWGFLREGERAFIIRRINRDGLDADTQPFTFKRFFKPALDLKIWGYGVMFG